MKRSFKSIMFVAAAAMAFTACNIEPVETPEEHTGTHKVTFVASQVDTKTTMEINGGVASFAWEDTDKAYFHIFENGVGVTGDDIDAEIIEGVMNISAVFPDSSAPYTYTGFMAATVSNDNPAVSNEQIDLGAYDPESDILVAKPVTDKTPEDILEGILFQFKRVVAINQMTLKGLTEGETVTGVTITSDKPIAGEYDFANGAWNASETSISIATEAEANADGQAVVYFVSAPVEAAQLTITATTTEGKTYSKELAKTITFAEGGVKAFGVTMESSEEVPPVEPAYVKVTSTADLTDGKYLIVYETGSVALDGELTSDVAANTVAVTISNGEIASTDDIDAAAVTFNAANGSFLGGGGKYIGHTGTSNTLNYSDKALGNEVSIDSEGNAVIDAGSTYVLRFNKTSGQERFRYYKGTQEAVQLYKYNGTIEVVSVTGVSLSQSVLELEVGESEPLVSTVLPENADNKSVTWSSNNEDVATVEDGVVTAVGVGEATITVKTVDGEFTDDCAVTVAASSVSIANTIETAYTASEAIALIDAGKDLDTPVYVKGIVSKIVTAFDSNYGNISFNVSADGATTGDQFQFFRNFKGENKNWTASDAPRVGDSVIGYGKLTKYNSTYEFEAGNYIVSIDRASYLEASASKVSGISAVGETITITVDTNIDSWSASITGDSTFALDEVNKTATTIPVIVSENTDVENGKNATVTITAGDKTVEIQLSQLAKTDGGQSSTAFEWTGSSENGRESLTSMVGVTASGLGTDYATSNAPYRVKFDTTGDYIIINVGYAIASVQLTVKMLGGANSSSIKIQESSDGDNFTDNSTMSISGKQNDVVDFTTSNAFNANSRYVKLYFTKGSNVGLGYIKISPNN